MLSLNFKFVLGCVENKFVESMLGCVETRVVKSPFIKPVFGCYFVKLKFTKTVFIGRFWIHNK